MSEHRISVEVGSEHIPRKFAMDRFRGEYKQFSLRNVNVMCIKHFIYVWVATHSFAKCCLQLVIYYVEATYITHKNITMFSSYFMW